MRATRPGSIDRIPRAAWLWLAWIVSQVALALRFGNGPNGDEGIYAWVGLRHLHDWPAAEGAEWINGSPAAWPAVAGWLWQLGGQNGLRLAAVSIASLAIWMAVRATTVLHGERAGLTSMWLLVLLGPLLVLAHFGVYDVPAMLWLAMAMHAMARRWTGGGVHWLWIAGGAAALAIITKYALVFVIPFVLLAAMVERRRDGLVFAGITAGLVALHNVALLGQIVPQGFGAWQDAGARLPSTLVAGEQLFLLLPVLLLVPRLLRAERGGWRDRWLAAAVVAFPIFHVLTGNPQSAQKHVAIGFLLAVPSLAQWCSAREFPPRRLFMLLGVVAAAQWLVLEYSWVDGRGVAARFAAEVRTGDRVLSNGGQFSYAPTLFTVGVPHPPETLDPEQPLVAGHRTWVLTETPLAPTEAAWLESAQRTGLRSVGEWESRHIGADSRRPFGLHRVTLTLWRLDP